MRLAPLSLPALAALALAGGLAVGTFAPTPGVGPSTPTPTTSIVLEDDPSWDCATHGNRICGPTSEADREAGWNAYDFSNGYRSLKVDPTRPYRVDYVGVSANPKLGEGETALIGRDFQWHVFRVTYTD